MKSAADKRSGTKHIGADIPAALAERFSAQCDDRGFVQKVLIRRWIEDWLDAPEITQIEFYHRRATRANAFRRQVEAVLRQLQVLPQETEDDAPEEKR